MEKSEISKELTDLLLKSIQDVVDGKGDVTDPPTDPKIKKDDVIDPPTDPKIKKGDEDKTTAFTLDDIVTALVPKLAKELKLKAGEGDDDTEPDKAQVSKTIKEALKTLGFKDDDIDVDMVIKRKRKGESVDDDESEVIFKSKHTDSDDVEETEHVEDRIDSSDGFHMTTEKKALNKELRALSKEDKAKALSCWFRGLTAR